MALINCHECGNQVSTEAAACPQCGAPPNSHNVGTPLATIQQTSKRLKIHILFSSLIFWIGLIWFFGSFAQEVPEPNPISILAILVGLIWFIVTRFRIWWHHK